MKLILLNGKRMTDKEKAHQYLKRKLQFPDYYGENLDALWDLLTLISTPIHIKLINYDILVNYLGQYGESIIETFKDSAIENENLIFEIDNFIG